ncbi:MAG: hypothetical protein HQM09_01950 [Candidatus Riflebacteria bacterium]|nr:hypothetical protein [Candidatus Riflebacteria bacterium]
MSITERFVILDIGGSGARGFALAWPDGPILPLAVPARNLRAMTDLELGELLLELKCSLEKNSALMPARWCIGGAGARPEADEKRFRELIGEVGIPFLDVAVFPDFEGNHAAALAGEDGIVSVNGTGSVLYGRIGGAEERRGGWGYLLDETPSGAVLGRFVLTGILAAWEGERETALLAEIYARRAVGWPRDRAGVVDLLYRSPAPQQLMGRLAPVFSEAITERCRWCRVRLDASMAVWAASMKSLAESLAGSTSGERIPFSGSGGLWSGWKAFSGFAQKALDEHAPERFILHPAAFDSAWGPLIRQFRDSDFALEDWKKRLNALAKV